MVKKTYFLIFSMLMLLVPLTTVYANVPSVLSITRRTEGSNHLIDIRVTHSDPSTSHYISQINLNLDGTVKSYTNLTKATTVEATYTINIEAANPQTLKAQAVCNTHGPSSFYTEGEKPSSGGGIPAYPSLGTFLGVLITFTLILLQNKRKNRLITHEV